MMYTFGEILLRQGILLGHFYATGCRVWRGFLHTHVTSLVTYLLQAMPLCVFSLDEGKIGLLSYEHSFGGRLLFSVDELNMT